MVDLLDDQFWIDHHTRADDRETVWVKDPGRDQVEREGSLIGLDRVAGVGAAVGADDDVGGRRQRIGELPLAFIAPLTPHHDCGGHRSGSPDLCTGGRMERSAGAPLPNCSRSSSSSRCSEITCWLRSMTAAAPATLMPRT